MDSLWQALRDVLNANAAALAKAKPLKAGVAYALGPLTFSPKDSLGARDVLRTERVGTM